ncbi:MAG: DUF938 domain-containing protein [Polyangiaceae bacterium]|nr:DUF938 domain-containing protein [Polyangiaceae bacterium]
MKASAPAADRNKGPIADVLRRLLPDRGVVLEIASGTGQHAAHFAATFPDVVFRPSDPSAEARASIDAYVREVGLPNLEPPVALDVRVPGWEQPVDVVLCINMIHIAPWTAAEALFDGASRCLTPGRGRLVLYGPYRFHGAFTAPSNEAFDESLRSRDPSWGVRDVDDLDVLAKRTGFVRTETIAMPANNHVLVFDRVEITDPAR